MPVAFPGESPEYRAARDALLRREIELRRLTEEVAEARRRLPPGGEVPQDYVFRRVDPGGEAPYVRLSELFSPGRDSLAVYSFMFGPDRAEACPMCTSLLDGLEGVAEHVGRQADFWVVASSSTDRLREFAAGRGWRRLRLLSTAGNDYNRDYFGRTPEGHETSMLNVFRRTGGSVRHFWGSELFYEPPEPGQDFRALDPLGALWNLLDFLPQGRDPHWRPKLSYS
ncbi:DUF899 family protein [Amycolatopsis sp. VS8301801F10]|uniref:DUF899 family protein n=1 Tax=unclassified Amycolatopsis TaxID=2618356 RepID=UPI0038FC6A11